MLGLIGNHDCLRYRRKKLFVLYSVTPIFSFIAGRIKFICLNTNAIEFDSPAPSLTLNSLMPS